MTSEQSVEPESSSEEIPASEDTAKPRHAGFAYRLVFKPLFLLRLVTDFARDAGGLVLGRRGKAAELRLASRFAVRGLWEFVGM